HLAGLGGGVSANQPAWIDSTAPLFAPVQASNSAPNTILLTLSGSDPDGDSLRAIITRLPSHGTLYQTTDGITPGAAITSVPAVLSNASLQVLYIRTAGFVGTDQFSYRVTDGYLTSAEAVARFQVINTSTSPLSLISAVADESFRRVTVTFSDPVLLSTATNVPNYTASGGLSIVDAQPGKTPAQIILRTSPQTEG